MGLNVGQMLHHPFSSSAKIKDTSQVQKTRQQVMVLNLISTGNLWSLRINSNFYPRDLRVQALRLCRSGVIFSTQTLES
jgi:hypothetical protein